MKAIHVGILTLYREEYQEFIRDNPILICTPIITEYDLQRETFDYFIRLDGWKKLDPELLRTVRAIEKIRDIDKAHLSPDSSFNWGLNSKEPYLIDSLHGLSHGKTYFDDLNHTHNHLIPMCDMRMGMNTEVLDEEIKKSREAFTKMSEQWCGASISMKDDAKGLTMFPDETIGTP